MNAPKGALLLLGLVVGFLVGQASTTTPGSIDESEMKLVESKVPHPTWLKACRNDRLDEMLALLGRSQIYQGLSCEKFIELTEIFQPQLLSDEQHLAYWPSDTQYCNSFLISLRTEIESSTAWEHQAVFDTMPFERSTDSPIPMKQTADDVQTPVREWLLVVRFAKATDALIDWKIVIGGKNLGE